jgi:hypothetical protein
LLDEAISLITRCNATYLRVDPKNSEFAVTEAFVVGVPDTECQEHVGAIIRTDSTHTSLEGLRQDLSTHLPFY